MITIKKEELLKDTIDYEDYSENIYKFTEEELRKEGGLQCGKCCMKNSNNKGRCNGCKNKNHCKK